MLRRPSPSDQPQHLRLAETTGGDLAADVEQEALDTVGAILRTLSRAATDPESSRQLDGWARHLLVLAPSPRSPGSGVSQRDWRGARAFALSHIQQASETTAKRLSGMRDVMWEMIESVSRSVGADTAGDARAMACIDRLREAIEAPAEDLRRSAFSAIDDLATLIAEREARQQELAGTLGSRVAELSLELAEARREAARDPLTELANRAVFDRELERACHLQTLTREPYVLLLFDVDGFKDVNDTWGHTVGDDALRTAARTLALTFPRRSDVVARYGGDEFAVILANTRLDEAETLADRFLRNVGTTTVAGPEGEIILSLSIGLAELAPTIAPTEIVRRADEALYAGKSAGRGRAAAWPV
jgi:diguanylate cyclase (GGDEF)-like protein